MTGRRRLPRGVLSSGSYFTVWSWLVTFPLAVTVLGGYDAATDASAKAVGVTIAVAVHVCCGLLGAAGAVVERRTARPAVRRSAVIATVAAIGLTRPLMIATLTSWAALPPYPGAMGVRVATNLLATSVALTIVALVVTTVRRRRRVVLALAAVVDALAAERTLGTDLCRQAAAWVAAGKQALQTAVQALASTPREDAATAVRRFAREAVRPLSHELYDSRARIAAEPPRPAPDARARVTGPFDLVAAPPPLATLLYLVLLAPFALSRMPAAQALTTVAAILVLGPACEAAGARLTSRLTAGWPRVLAVIAAASVTAAVIVAATMTVGTLMGATAGSVRIAGATYVLVALAAARCTAVLASLTTEEDALAARVGAFRADETEGRRRAEQLLTDAAGCLHGDLQGGCVALAAALDTGADTDWPECLHEIRAIVDGVDRPRAASPDPRGAFDELVRVWGRVIDLDVRADAEAFAVLAAHPALAGPFLDAVAESLTNVLRHAGSPAAVLCVDAAASEVVLTVCSPGAPGAGAGAGLRELARRADSLHLEEADGRTRLRVRFAARS